MGKRQTTINFDKKTFEAIEDLRRERNLSRSKLVNQLCDIALKDHAEDIEDSLMFEINRKQVIQKDKKDTLSGYFLYNCLDNSRKIMFRTIPPNQAYKIMKSRLEEAKLYNDMENKIEQFNYILEHYRLLFNELKGDKEGFSSDEEIKGRYKEAQNNLYRFKEYVEDLRKKLEDTRDIPKRAKSEDIKKALEQEDKEIKIKETPNIK